jgi:NTP pyrophosphatase (non-canonical NTP hydrolase)
MSSLSDMMIDAEELNRFSAMCHEAEISWWKDLKTGEPLNRNKGELLMLIVSEIAEAMEGERKNLMDDKLPHRRQVEVELADALIRIFDYAGGYGLDLGSAVVEKMAYNAKRKDHTREERLKENGKKF